MFQRLYVLCIYGRVANPNPNPQATVFAENEGTSTIDQAHKIKAILHGSNIKIMKLVTSEFHIIRAKKCMDKVFDGYISDIGCSSGLTAEQLNNAVQKETELTAEYVRRGWI